MPAKKDARWEIKKGRPTFRTAPADDRQDGKTELVYQFLPVIQSLLRDPFQGAAKAITSP